MKSSLRLTLVALVLAAAACTGNSAPVEQGGNGPSPDGAPAALNDSVRIALGSAAVFDGGRFSVRFLERVKDDRCPINAICVRAGSGQVRVRFQSGGAALDARLGIGERDPAAPGTVSVGGYTVTLLELSPYPGQYDEGSAPPPSIAVRVTK